VLGQKRLNEILRVGLEASERAGFVIAHEPCVTDHVRGHDRREFAVNARGHGGTVRIYRRT
jgi:hypothetical protein